MKMPLVLALSAAFTLAATCSAATRTWTGAGGDNEWTNTLNWAESAVPGSSDTAVFNNAAPLSLRIDRTSGYLGATHFKFLGADVTIGSEDTDSGLYIYGSSTSTVEVVAGTTVTCSNYLYMYHANNIALAKKGGGTFRHVYKNNYIGNLKKLVVEGGRMERDYLSNASHVLPDTKNVHVGEGADYFSSGYTSFSSNGGGLSLDGGTFTVGLNNVPHWWQFGGNDNRRPDVEVGEGGGTLRAVDYYTSYNSDEIRIRMYSSFKTASGVSKDGGVVLDLRDCGVGFMPLAPFLVNGPVTVRDGRLLLAKYGNSEYADLANYPSFFGTGDFTLDCSVLDYTEKPASTFMESGTLRLASGAGSKMTVRGASEIRFSVNASANFQHIVVGADDAAAGSALVRERGGALFIYDNGQLFNGERSTVKVNGGVATNGATSLVKAPIFSENTVGGNGKFSFLCYDGEKGLYEFTDYASFSSAGENDVVGVDGSSDVSLAANATKHIAALRLGEWRSLTLNAGSCLEMGNGTDPASVLLSYKSHILGTGTIDFGSSEGVIAAGIMLEADATEYGGHRIQCRLTGSGGVSYVTRLAYGFRMVSVSGENDYSGATHISAVTVLPRSASAFSTGDVYVNGGYRNGGKIVFDRPLTFANAFHVSGAGHRPKMYDNPDFFGRGALSFQTNDVVLTGPVELKAKTEVSAMPAGASGTFAGTISGDRLVVRPGEGRIVLAAHNTYTGGTEIKSATVVLSGASPSVGTGRVTLDNGVLRFENTVPMTFSNDLDGVGSVEVAGADVTFASPQLADLKHKTMSSGMSFDFPQLTEHRPPSGLSIFVR